MTKPPRFHPRKTEPEPEPLWAPVEAFMLLERISPSDLIRLARQGLLPRIEYAGDRPFVHMPSLPDWRTLAFTLNDFRRLADVELQEEPAA
ncbi:hypothetical protein G5V57_24365 [Nordella sp. HKS 07]|uniref:hypothetical protein n=1 Tax=Nordella sp. HKS 07 TaxID=2712222 RepID=UPI0013E19F1A|nr:hypothetical protein [Nordella sp. HKS 07]QIG50587.1 hypothetical protein G5V57_24365 [Nordella sp. HKS 07]